MPAHVRFGSVQLTAGGAAADHTPDDRTPFRVLVIGDFGSRTRPGLYSPIRVDRDNFDTLPGKLGVIARFAGAGEIPIREMDDFHPDKLWATVPAFDELKTLRRKLQNPKTFADAAAVVTGWDQPVAAAALPVAPRSEASAPPSALEDLLGKSMGEIVASSQPDGGELAAFIRQTAAKYSVPADDPKRGDHTRRVDVAAAGVMREILHDKRFQAVEAAWRGLGLIVRRLDTDESVHLSLLDVSHEELADDLAADDLTASKFYDAVVRREVDTPGGKPWALVVGAYTFGPTTTDADVLGRVAKVVSCGGAAFIAGGSQRLAGCESFAKAPEAADWVTPSGDDADAWRAMRALPEAAHLGLAAPRLLLRVPYSKDSGSVEGFDFEESPVGHEEFLWGCSAFAGALVLGEAFERAKWQLASALRTELTDLPLAIVTRDGEAEAVPCAEALLSRSAVDRLRDAGLSVLRSVRNADRAEFASLMSVAQPMRPIAGRWE